MPQAGLRLPAASDVGWPAARRLRRGAEFDRVRAAHRTQTIRATTPFLTMTALWIGSDDATMVRFGIIVGRRQAPRAVDRSLIKRIVREAARASAAALEALCGERKLRADIVFRLRAPLTASDGAKLPLTVWRKQLRSEANGLLAELARRLGALSKREPADA